MMRFSMPIVSENFWQFNNQSNHLRSQGQLLNIIFIGLAFYRYQVFSDIDFKDMIFSIFTCMVAHEALNERADPWVRSLISELDREQIQFVAAKMMQDKPGWSRFLDTVVFLGRFVDMAYQTFTEDLETTPENTNFRP